MYLNGEIVWDENTMVTPMTNIYTFFNTFGQLVYEINGKTKVQKLGFKQVLPTRVNVKMNIISRF